MEGRGMKCPKCGKENTCGCESCRKYNPNPNHQIDVTHKYPEAEKAGYAIWACPHCGYHAGDDQWLEIEAKEHVDSESSK
jgi:uncharacterized protein (DUF2225 family)